jgi:hypothetical protein
MLTIENIDKIKVGTFKVGEDKWEIKMVQTSSDVYQFVLQCIEAHTASGLFREAVIDLSRVSVAGMLGADGDLVYKLNNVSNGVTHFVTKKDLRAPGLFCGPILKILEGC